MWGGRGATRGSLGTERENLSDNSPKSILKFPYAQFVLSQKEGGGG